MFVHAPLAWLVPTEARRGRHRMPSDGYELSCGYWELDLIPPEEELGLLITKLSLHPSAIYFVIQLHSSPEQTL